MKKVFVFFGASILMLLAACNESTVTPKKNISYNNISYNKLTIQNDSNWVEVFDIDSIKLCFGPFYWDYKNQRDHNIIINSENEYKTIFDDAVATTGKDFHFTKCDTIYQPTDVDFNNRFMIIYNLTSADDKFTRQIFKNKCSNEYLYLVSINRLSLNKIGRSFIENISLPKISYDTKVVFDTLHVNF
jgi:hypothetical protein